MSFAELLKAVDEVEGIERVRYMTSHPKDLSDEVIEAVKNGRHICEHFHIPVQYGTDKLLKRMNRKYTVAQYKALVERIRSHIRSDVIRTAVDIEIQISLLYIAIRERISRECWISLVKSDTMRLIRLFIRRARVRLRLICLTRFSRR